MRALTLHRPWDWAMAHGGKDIENRPWKPYESVVGQRIALHAGNTFDHEGARYISRICKVDRFERSPGVIVATTRVIGWILLAHDPDGGGTVVVKTSEMPVDRFAPALKSPWLFGPYAWLCEDTVALPEPVPHRGGQGLRSLPAEVEAEVLRQEALAWAERRR